MTERPAHLEAILADGMLDPTPANLLAARVLVRWRIVVSPSGFTGLRGDLLKNGVWTGRKSTPHRCFGWSRAWVDANLINHLLAEWCRTGCGLACR